MQNPQRSWPIRLLMALAQNETERGGRVLLRLFMVLVLTASILWFTARPFGDTVPPIYWLGWRVGWWLAGFLMPLLAIAYGASLHIGATTPPRQSAGRHWLIAGVAMLFGMGAVDLSRHFLHPLAAGHWTLSGGQIFVLVMGAFLALAIQAVLLAVLRSATALIVTVPVWAARSLLRRWGRPTPASGPVGQ